MFHQPPPHTHPQLQKPASEGTISIQPLGAHFMKQRQTLDWREDPENPLGQAFKRINRLLGDDDKIKRDRAATLILKCVR